MRVSSIHRLFIVTLLLLGASVVIGRATQAESVPPRERFATFPMTIDAWSGRPDTPFTQHVLDVLGVDDYLSRTYVTSDREATNLYMGFYEKQREGDTIHSPLNCLPGAGWEPIDKVRAALNTPTGPVEVNELVIEKGIDHQLVLYWYQSHGRVVASEYWGKTFLVLDALRLNRTDGAMIRVIASVGDNVKEGRPKASAMARQFAERIFPLLGRYLPT
jgi:EpsI family protein